MQPLVTVVLMSAEFVFKNVRFECLDKQRYSLDVLNREHSIIEDRQH